MNLTVGPHPPSVYWRRRAAVGAPLLFVLILFSSCVASGDTEQGGKGAQRKNAAVKQQDECSKEDPCETVVGGQPTATQAAGSALQPNSSAPPLLIAPSPRPTPTNGKPGTCADGDIELTVSPDKSSYKVGNQPRLTMVVRNKSDRPCIRDVGPSHQELRVLADGKRIWSSDDCSPNTGDDRRTLKPGEKRTYWLTWSGRSSSPGCPKTRVRVGAGSYELVGRLQDMTSSSSAFTIVTR